MPLTRRAVGFYWTLPVPWAGFTRLPADVGEAAKASHTIRYQRELLHDYAKRHSLEIVHEAAFLEIDPDRGSELIYEALDKSADACHEHGALLLFVEFAGVQGWRDHNLMQAWLRKAKIECLPIEAVPIRIDGRLFDPHAHFANWRRSQREWSEGKSERRRAAIERVVALRANGLTNGAIAEQLNAQGLRSLSGKRWTAELVRKLGQSGGVSGAASGTARSAGYPSSQRRTPL